MSADTSWMPEKGDTVTWGGRDGTWIVRSWEDDDTVWVHRTDVRMMPMIGRSSAGWVDLVGWRDEPEHEELVSVAELRPVEADRLAEQAGEAHV